MTFDNWPSTTSPSTTSRPTTSRPTVRDPTGISHSPDEFAEREDCHSGVEALAAVTEELAR